VCRMSKELLDKNIKKIECINSFNELEDFSKKISISNANDKDKEILLKAVEDRRAKIIKRDNNIAINGDLDDIKIISI